MNDSRDFSELPRDGRGALAFEHAQGAGPPVVFFSGFHSAMTGSKGSALSAWARRRARAFVRFDYSGHGASEGRFEEGVIGAWRQDALDVLDALNIEGAIFVGSSMGAWIATLAALARPHRAAGLLLIAPALDFTEALLFATLPPEGRAALAQDGVWLRPSLYEAPVPITRALIEEGRSWLLLDKPIAFHGPVRIVQGLLDPDVPWRHAVETLERLESPDARLTLIKDGDHRLSRPQDLALLEDLLDRWPA